MRNTNELLPVKCDQQLTDVFYSPFNGTQAKLYQRKRHRQLPPLSPCLFFKLTWDERAFDHVKHLALQIPFPTAAPNTVPS